MKPTKKKRIHSTKRRVVLIDKQLGKFLGKNRVEELLSKINSGIVDGVDRAKFEKGVVTCSVDMPALKEKLTSLGIGA